MAFQSTRSWWRSAADRTSICPVRSSGCVTVFSRRRTKRPAISSTASASSWSGRYPRLTWVSLPGSTARLSG
ncbi:hypothetical protein NKH18_47435 [Streptomyces sp. M10(2022)]